MRISQICLSVKGRFWPVSLPLFQGMGILGEEGSHDWYDMLCLLCVVEETEVWLATPEGVFR